MKNMCIHYKKCRFKFPSLFIIGKFCEDLCYLDCGPRAECVINKVNGTNVQECVCTGPDCTEATTGTIGKKRSSYAILYCLSDTKPRGLCSRSSL